MLKNLAAIAGATLLSLGLAQTAKAGTFYNDWNYSLDAFGDGAGGAIYDIKGLAVKQTQDEIFVAIRGNTPLGGVYNDNAAGNRVGWGDLFFNFTEDSFNTASKNEALFGIRFDAKNESGVSQLGVYGAVKAKSITADNDGYHTLRDYYSDQDGRYDVANTVGELSTKTEAYQYFTGKPNGNTTQIKNVIKHGTYLGGLDFLSSQQASDAGLDFSHFNAGGSELIAFKFKREFLPTADFIASVFLECGNDGVAIKGKFENTKVPEPSAVGGLVALGLMGSNLALRKRRQLGKNAEG